MKITKKIENKYFVNCMTGKRELNSKLGYRNITVCFTNDNEWLSEYEGQEYIICLEAFLNDCDKLDWFIECGSQLVIGNTAEVVICVNDEDIKLFNDYYKIFKERCNEIVDDFRTKVEAMSNDICLTYLDTLEAWDEAVKKNVPKLNGEVPPIKIMSKEQLYTNIENLVKNKDFTGIVGFYDKGGWITEVRDRGTNILFVVDEKMSIYLNKDEKFDDTQGWIDFIKDNA